MYTSAVASHAHVAPRRATLWTPRNLWLFSFAVLCCLILANAFGSILLVGFLGLCFGMIVAWPRLLAESSRYPMVWALPVLAMLSVLWSRDPSQSFRLGAEYLFTTLCGLLLARIQNTRSFISSLMCALLLADAFSVAIGGSETISYTGQDADHGVFGSKNIFAFLNAWLMLTAFAVLMDKNNSRMMRLLGLVGTLGGAVLLLKARSIGAVAAIGIAMVVFVLFIMLARTPARWRGAVFMGPVLVGLMVAVIGMVLLQTGGFGELLQMVGKSSDLTGRGYMWIRAAEYIKENPLLGMGYQAFWVQGFVEAEGMWQYMHIPNRSGVHFHNMYYETAVELGMVGVAVLAATLVALMWRLLRRAFLDPGPESAYLMAFFVYILSRLYLEVDLLFPFAYGSLVLPVLWVHSGSQRYTRQVPARAAHWPTSGGAASGGLGTGAAA